MKRTALASALALGLFTVFAAPAALAQAITAQADADKADPADSAKKPTAADKNDEAAAAGKPTTLDTVRVTGSRIPRAGFDTLEPATVITRAYIEARGLTNIADAINEQPGFGVGATPEAGQSSFGVGVNFVNKFGLGTARTLSLINGRRVVSANTPSIFGPAAPGLQVDLNVIPSQMVERIETLTIGGAPTYGSDAIAGVVNVITRTDYQGSEVSATYGITDRSDNLRQNISAITGINFSDDRGNAVVSVSYDKIDAVPLTARKWGGAAFSFRPNPCANTVAAGRTPANDGRVNPDVPFQTCTPSAGTDGIPNAVLIRNDRFSTFTGGGRILGANLQFAPNGDIVAFDPGVPFGTTNASGGDGFNLAETAQLTSGIQRRTGTFNLTYEVTDNTRFFFEGLYYNADSEELIDQPIFNVNLFGGLSAPIRFSNAYPLLTAQNRTALAAANLTTFQLSRASRDLVTNNATAENEIVRSVFGFDGNFEFADRQFYWEVSANIGHNDSSFFGTVLNQQNFINALNVAVDGSGNVVCTTTPTPGLVIPGGGAPRADANCVPLNLFGEGRPSDAARAYVTDRTRSRSTIDQTVFNANLGGSLFDTWGGPVGFNIGFERRIEAGNFEPDFFQQNGLGRAVTILPNSGSFGTKEIFAEAIIPLVNPDADVLLLKRLDITGKYRHVDNTVNGTFDAYTFGAQWSPVDDVLFRGNFTRSLRAPAITELFTPVSGIFTLVPDPCDTRNVNGGTRPDVRQANCAAFYQAFGLNPNNFQSNAVGATVRGSLSGDPNLGNESSDSYTAGVVIQPRWVEGLRIAVDWNQIEISNTIANLGAAAIATGCFDNRDFDAADVANANSFCSRIIREANGQIEFIRTGFVNGGFQNLTAWTAEVAYSKDLADWGFGPGGTLYLGATAFHLSRLENSINNVVTNDDRGEIGNAMNQLQLSMTYDHRDWGVNFQGNFQSSAETNNDNSAEATDILRTGDYWEFDGGVFYRITDKARVNLAVTNVFDKNPPIPTLGNAAGVFDILGRRYSVTLNWKF